MPFCNEAGACVMAFFRQLIDLGHGSTVAAPLPIACKPGERIKTD